MLVLGARYRGKLEHGLRQLGQSVFWLPDNPDVDPRLAGHVDLSLFRGKDGSIVAARGVFDNLVKYLTNTKSVCSNKVYSGMPQGKTYPADAGLCVCVTEKYTIYNPKTIDPAARDHLCGKLIPVTQGYTKCSVSVVTDEAIITEDSLIAARAASVGMDVLQITPGYVFLEGFDYGFIGGATFLLNDQLLAFTGKLKNHPDKDRILTFLRIHAVEPVFLTDAPVFDIGGAILL